MGWTSGEDASVPADCNICELYSLHLQEDPEPSTPSRTSCPTTECGTQADATSIPGHAKDYRDLDKHLANQGTG